VNRILSGIVLTSFLGATLTFAQTSIVSPPTAPSPDNSSLLLANAPFHNPSLPIAERVNDLVSRMTLEEKAAQMMHAAPAIPRLGIPAYNWWSEGLHGVANTGYATVFPQAIGMAASFDPDLLHTEAGIVATEFRATAIKLTQI
jgi:beta-glucosidase-like glycosyl hydrolase